MPESLKMPLLNDLAPDGFFYGGHYIVEFDPDSLWYETSLTIAALAVKRGIKTQYHVFQHYPSEAMEALSKLGVDPKKSVKDGLLSFWDSYTETVEYEASLVAKRGRKSALDKPLDLKGDIGIFTEKMKAGIPEEEKDWIHLDDNSTIFLQYNDEASFLDIWRTVHLPGTRATRRAHFLAFAKGVASPTFYSKFEAICDGIIDVKSQEEGDKIENYIRIRVLRGKTFDSRWHRLEVMKNGEVRLVGASSQGEQRRLAAIMFTDIVDYTGLTQLDESLAIRLLERHRELIRPILPKHSGREVKTIGDAFLFEFGSALEATECAVEIQKTLHEYNEGASDKILLRIGIHVGDVIHKGGDVYGDAVNVASRIEPLAASGGICISEQAYDQVRNKIPYKLTKLSQRKLKNVKFEIDVYELIYHE